jgi:transposase-like protein
LDNQPVITFSQYQKHFLTEKSCSEYLYNMKWPEGFQCSKCRHTAYYVIVTRNYPLYECRRCGNQTTLTVGTILEKTHTDITTWFAAIFLVVQDKQVSTAQIAKQLEISYQTAWSMVWKIRMALANPRCIASAPKFSED